MARVYDFWLGGKDNFAADRAVAEQVAAAYPDVLVAVRAQRAAPASRVVYVDNDPIVLGHARALLSSSPEGGRLHRRRPARHRHDPGAGGRRAGLRAAGRGSYLAISQITSDVAADEVAEGVQRYNAQAAAPVAARTQAEVCRFFAGLELLEPASCRYTGGGQEPGPGQRPQPRHFRRGRTGILT
jgi:S-adenosyl methyltransferase